MEATTLPDTPPKYNTLKVKTLLTASGAFVLDVFISTVLMAGTVVMDVYIPIVLLLLILPFWLLCKKEKPPVQKKGIEEMVDALLAWEREQGFPPPDLNTATCPDPPDKLLTPHVLQAYFTVLNSYLPMAGLALTIPVSSEAKLRETMTKEEFFVLFMRVERFSKMREEAKRRGGPLLEWANPVSICATLAMREGIAPKALHACITGAFAQPKDEYKVLYNRLANFTRAHVLGWGNSEETDATRADTPESS